MSGEDLVQGPHPPSTAFPFHCHQELVRSRKERERGRGRPFQGKVAILCMAELEANSTVFEGWGFVSFGPEFGGCVEVANRRAQRGRFQRISSGR